jgi:PKD repeat protein
MHRAMVGIITLLLFFGLFSGCIFPAENRPPVPYLAASATFIDVGEEVIFSGNESVDKDGEIKRYFWDFGDGTNTTGKYVTHEYEEGGNYTVVLIVTDDGGKKAVQTITVHVNELPDPYFEPILPAYIHEPVFFYANDSFDYDGFITDYFWDFGDGTNGTGMVTSHIFQEKKTFRVTLTVTDNDGAKAAFPLEVEIIYREYEVTWVIDKVQIDAESRLVHNEGESHHTILNVYLYNVTRLKFNLTWDDDKKNLFADPPNQIPNDDFILNVTSPGEKESYQQGPSDSQKIIIYAPKSGVMNPVPTEFIIEAESEDAVYDEISLNHTSTGGTGNWKVNITIVEAAGARETFPVIDTDNGNSWTLILVAYYYTPIVTKIE